MQRPVMARAVREEWAEEIEAAQTYIDVLTVEEETRFENAAKERGVDSQ